MPFDSEATVEHAVPERLSPPACENDDIVVTAPQEVDHAAAEPADSVPADRDRRRDGGGDGGGLLCPLVGGAQSGIHDVSAHDAGVRPGDSVIQRRSAAGEITARRADYFGYLSDMRAVALKTAAAQRESVIWCHPEPATLWTLVGGRRMWERGAADADFCQVRIGVGTVPLATHLVAPARVSKSTWTR